MAGPDRPFWQRLFEQNTTPWDRGSASPQLLTWLENGTLKPCRILVPGCGHGYEILALAAAGFEVTALDYAPAAVERAAARLRAAGLYANILQADVREWMPDHGLFDAIYEQTCLCALHPDDWTQYAGRLHAWLRPQGRLFGLFMQALRDDAAQGLIHGPPYHCDMHAMRALFPASRWDWPAPPYAHVPHPMGVFEIGIALQRKPDA